MPSLLFLEIVNAAARRWSWGVEPVRRLARELAALGLEVDEPEIDAVARWTSRGLTAYDGAYVALAERRGVRLVTDDQRVIAAAGSIALPLAEYATAEDIGGS